MRAPARPRTRRKGHSSTDCPHCARIVDNSSRPGPKFVDKAVVAMAARPISFDLPEGAGGTDAGPVSNHRTGSPNRRRRGRKAGETEGAGAAATRPGLLGSGVGVTVRYGSFGRFRVRR